MPRLAAVIVTCPACVAQYRLADDAIPPAGRKMRCASCGNVWTAPRDDGPTAPAPPAGDPPSAPPPAAPPPVLDAAAPRATRIVAPPVPAPEEPRRDQLPPDPAAEVDPDAPRPRAVLKTLVAIVLGLLFLAGAIALQLRQSGRLPELPAWLNRPLSAPQRPVVLSLRFEHTERVLPGGFRLVELTGEIANPSATPQPVPPLEARLADDTGTMRYRWTIAAPVRELAPGRAAKFDSSAFNPPPGAHVLSVRFAR